MDFLINDLSLHGQFPSIDEFSAAIGRVMLIKQNLASHGFPLYCHKSILNSTVINDIKLQQAVNMMEVSERRSLMSWVTKYGPFWEDSRNHSSDEWLELDSAIVTDSAIGEAAWCCLNGLNRGLISLTPSNWLTTPLPVEWIRDNGERACVGVENFWEITKTDAYGKSVPVVVMSWPQLRDVAISRFPLITFSASAFEPLAGSPFSSSAAQRFIFLCHTLNALKSCFDDKGQRTSRGHELYQNFFTGKKEDGGRGALFSDSSDSELNDFTKEMTFDHPEKEGEVILCSWHGKIQTPQMRLHFSWPIVADTPLYVTYLGPKITKR